MPEGDEHSVAEAADDPSRRAGPPPPPGGSDRHACLPETGRAPGRVLVPGRLFPGGMADELPRSERLLSRESRRFPDAPYAADRIEAGWQYVLPGCEQRPAERDARQDETDA